MNDQLALLEQTLQFDLPYTDTEYCYQQLAQFPQLLESFQMTIVPLAVQGGPLAERLAGMEAAREKALREHEAGRPSLREHEPPFNCCLGDLYYALFDSLAKAVNDSELDADGKSQAMAILRESLGQILDWNPTKRMEIGFRLLVV